MGLISKEAIPRTTGNMNSNHILNASILQSPGWQNRPQIELTASLRPLFVPVDRRWRILSSEVIRFGGLSPRSGPFVRDGKPRSASFEHIVPKLVFSDAVNPAIEANVNRGTNEFRTAAPRAWNRAIDPPWKRDDYNRLPAGMGPRRLHRVHKSQFQRVARAHGATCRVDENFHLTGSQ